MKTDGDHISVFSRIVDDVLGHEREAWTGHVGPHWHGMTPSHSPRRLQGWKIHLSAEPRSAEEVLRRATAVLAAERCPFKFTRDPSALRSALGRGFDRAGSGKFLTVYPADDDRFRVLVKELHEATAELTGPRILSDRFYAPGSLVHYRYGGFSPVTEYGPNGLRRDMLIRPDGTLEPDLRVPWFRSPEWAHDPLETGRRQRTEVAAHGEASTSVLVNGRYRVTGAIRHTNRGGVFRAVDTMADDARVIIKQARPYTDIQSDGRDARDMLLNEAKVLAGLQDTGLCARFVEDFTIHGEQFVVQSELAGQTLEDWVLQSTAHGGELPLGTALACVDALVALLGQVHAAGIVLQDFSPGNVLRHEDGSQTLIDLETAARVGEAGGELMTPGFSAPERRSARRSGDLRPAAFADDLYSLGAVICFLAVEQAPLLISDRAAAARPDRLRLRLWLDAAAEAGRPLARRVRPLVEGLTEEEPVRRWGMTTRGPAFAGLFGGHGGALWVAHDLARAVGDVTNQERALELAARLPVDGEVPDDLYQGTAGTGMALLHLWRTTGDERMRAGARACADTLLRQAVGFGSAPAWPSAPGNAHTPGAAGPARRPPGDADEPSRWTQLVQRRLVLELQQDRMARVSSGRSSGRRVRASRMSMVSLKAIS